MLCNLSTFYPECKNDGCIKLLARRNDFRCVPSDCNNVVALRDELINSEIRVALRTNQSFEITLDLRRALLPAGVWNDGGAGTVEFAIPRATVKDRLNIAASECVKQRLNESDVSCWLMARSYRRSLSYHYWLTDLLLKLNPARIQRIQRRLRLLHFAIAVREALRVAGNPRVFELSTCSGKHVFGFRDAALDG